MTDSASIGIDHDMDYIVAAAGMVGLSVDLCHWDSNDVEWTDYSALLFRSPWSYTERSEEFSAWCRSIRGLVSTYNSIEVALWALDKHYLIDLHAGGINTIPTVFFCRAGTAQRSVESVVEEFEASNIVIKPSVGAYSRSVRRFHRDDIDEANEHIRGIHAAGSCALVQPYLESIDSNGEVNIVFINGRYSHAVRKSALLQADGSMAAPTLDTRSFATATRSQIRFGTEVIEFARIHTAGSDPLLYGRIDIVRDEEGQLALLEMDICEPSLNLNVRPSAAYELMSELARRIKCSRT